MKHLFRTALFHHKHRFLLGLTIIAMCLLTLASQMEIFALSVIMQKGPDAFELFGPIKDGKIQASQEISLENVNAQWPLIDTSHTGTIDKVKAAKYIQQWKNQNFVEKSIQKLDSIFPIKENIVNLSLFLVFVALFKAITLFIQRFSTRLVAIRISQDLRQDYFEHIQSLPMSFYQQHNIGSLSSRVVGDAALIAEAINACLVNYMQLPFTVISTLTLCFLTSWQLSLIIFFGLPLIIFPIIFLAKRVKRVSKQLQQNQELFASVLIDFLSGIQTVKVFAMEGFSLKKYKQHNDKMAALEKKSARYDLSSRPIVHTIGMLFLATILVCGLYVLNMNVPDVLFYGGLLYVFYEPVKKFAEENSRIQRGIAAAERMFEVMEIKPNIRDEADAIALSNFESTIEFDNVWFRYEEQWALKGISFTVNKGETVAIVGATGAGKSTIAQLLPRLYDVQKGEIRINGKSITHYTVQSLRESIAYVPQKSFLFLDTIAENIAYGKGFSREQVQAAAERAYAHEFICQLPLGYDSEVSEGGKNFSGGQQQRLSIARALIKDAPILIMDEATSSLDSISENHIKKAIRQLHGKMTQIIIAHRPSTIEDADRIIYLEHGQIVAIGPKDQLLQTCQGFKEMWEMMHNQHSRNSIK